MTKVAMNPKTHYDRISFEEFQKRAQDNSLSKYEKIGFPDDYRKGKEENIFNDISKKLKLDRKGLKILDIGCGCSDLANFIIKNAELYNQELFIMDSAEMLNLLPESKNIREIPGQFPKNYDLLKSYEDHFHAIICYSVIQHVILDTNPYSFIDKALNLLKPTGILLLGDIPNNSKRNRYFSSERGLKAHQDFVNSTEIPAPLVNYPDTFEKIDDGLLFGILMRYRGFGLETYIVPQADDLPMANRREDIIIFKN